MKKKRILAMILILDKTMVNPCEYEEGQITNQSIASGNNVPKGTEIFVGIDQRY